MTTDLDRLGAAQYVSVTTYRRDGTGVPTPVWVVRDGDGLAVWTPTKSGKVKRVRRDPRVTVAPCDFGGNLQGDPMPGHAEILTGAGTARVRDLLRHKYGLTARLTLIGSRIRRGLDGTVGIRITLDSA
jgi:PPOX class probable F420-dependent enzyme